jgi:hypothetical protein
MPQTRSRTRNLNKEDLDFSIQSLHQNFSQNDNPIINWKDSQSTKQTSSNKDKRISEYFENTNLPKPKEGLLSQAFNRESLAQKLQDLLLIEKAIEEAKTDTELEVNIQISHEEAQLPKETITSKLQKLPNAFSLKSRETKKIEKISKAAPKLRQRRGDNTLLVYLSHKDTSNDDLDSSLNDNNAQYKTCDNDQIDDICKLVKNVVIKPKSNRNSPVPAKLIEYNSPIELKLERDTCKNSPSEVRKQNTPVLTPRKFYGK